MATLLLKYREQGAFGVAKDIAGRAQGPPGRRNIYLLVDRNLRALAGNISQWPTETADRNGWVDFTVTMRLGTSLVKVPSRARVVSLPGGARLLVGRDLTERQQFQLFIGQSIGSAAFLFVVLTLFAGYFTARSLLRRVDLINSATHEIFKGNLKRRIALSGSNDEFDELARNLNQMLDRLDQLMAEIRDITDDIAHDLRTPLSRLRNRLESGLIGQLQPAGYREVISQAIAEADDLLTTFGAMLDIARVEGGTLDDEMRTVNLTAIVSDVTEFYRALAEDKGIGLNDGSEPDILVRGHQHFLSQAISNLLENAIKFTPSGGHVRIVCERRDGNVHLSISDTGPGIPEAMRDHVLRRFARLEASRTTAGSGLGLSLVKAIADRHGAAMQLLDNDPGLTVTLIFPANN